MADETDRPPSRAHGVSYTVLAGRRYVLYALGEELVVSVQCTADKTGAAPTPSSASAPPFSASASASASASTSVVCGFETVQRLHAAHDGHIIVAARWFSDNGGCGSGYESVDGGNAVRGWGWCFVSASAHVIKVYGVDPTSFPVVWRPLVITRSTSIVTDVCWMPEGPVNALVTVGEVLTVWDLHGVSPSLESSSSTTAAATSTSSSSAPATAPLDDGSGDADDSPTSVAHPVFRSPVPAVCRGTVSRVTVSPDARLIAVYSPAVDGVLLWYRHAPSTPTVATSGSDDVACLLLLPHRPTPIAVPLHSTPTLSVTSPLSASTQASRRRRRRRRSLRATGADHTGNSSSMENGSDSSDSSPLTSSDESGSRSAGSGSVTPPPRDRLLETVPVAESTAAHLVSLQWRPIVRDPQTPQRGPATAGPAVLLGLWSDGRARLWRETDATERFGIAMCASWGTLEGDAFHFQDAPDAPSRASHPPPSSTHRDHQPHHGLCATWVSYSILQDRLRGSWLTSPVVEATTGPPTTSSSTSAPRHTTEAGAAYLTPPRRSAFTPGNISRSPVRSPAGAGASAGAGAGAASRPPATPPTRSRPRRSSSSSTSYPEIRVAVWPPSRHTPPASASPSAALGLGLLPPRTRHRDFVMTYCPMSMLSPSVLSADVVARDCGGLALLFSVEGCCDEPQQATQVSLCGSAHLPAPPCGSTATHDLAPLLYAPRVLASCATRLAPGSRADGGQAIAFALSDAITNRQWTAPRHANATSSTQFWSASDVTEPVDLWTHLAGTDFAVRVGTGAAEVRNALSESLVSSAVHHMMRTELPASLAAAPPAARPPGSPAPPTPSGSSAPLHSWQDLRTLPVSRAANTYVAKPIPLGLTLLFQASDRAIRQAHIVWNATPSSSSSSSVEAAVTPSPLNSVCSTHGTPLQLLGRVVALSSVASLQPSQPVFTVSIWSPAVARSLPPVTAPSFPFDPELCPAATPVAVTVDAASTVRVITSYGQTMTVGVTPSPAAMAVGVFDSSVPVVFVATRAGSVVVFSWNTGATAWQPQLELESKLPAAPAGVDWVALKAVPRPDSGDLVLCGVVNVGDDDAGRVVVWRVVLDASSSTAMARGRLIPTAPLPDSALAIRDGSIASVPPLVLHLLAPSSTPRHVTALHAVAVLASGRVVGQFLQERVKPEEGVTCTPLTWDGPHACPPGTAIATATCGFVVVVSPSSSATPTILNIHVLRPPTVITAAANSYRLMWSAVLTVPPEALADPDSGVHCGVAWHNTGAALPQCAIHIGRCVIVLSAVPASLRTYRDAPTTVPVVRGWRHDDRGGPVDPPDVHVELVPSPPADGVYGWYLNTACWLPHTVWGTTWGPGGHLWATHCKPDVLAPAHLIQVAGVASDGSPSVHRREGALQQYHPAALMSDLSAGHVARVQRVLGHVAVCIRRAKAVADARAKQREDAADRRNANHLKRLERMAEGGGGGGGSSGDDFAVGHASTDSEVDDEYDYAVTSGPESSHMAAQMSATSSLQVAIPTLPLRVLLSATTTSTAAATASSASSGSRWGSGAVVGGDSGGGSRWGSGAVVGGDAGAGAGAGTRTASPDPSSPPPPSVDGARSPELNIARRASLSHAAFPFSTDTGLTDFMEDVVAAVDRAASAASDDKDELNSAYCPQFGADEADTIASELPTSVIPGLSPTEHLLLLAVSSVTHSLFGGSLAASLDSAGSHFLVACKLFEVSRKCLPPHLRPPALSYSAMLWALHSDSQDSLVGLCLQPMPLWAQLRALGIPLWLRSDRLLTSVLERCAKTQYMRSGRDPFACLLLYLAMGLHKLPVVLQLFRLSQHAKVYGFLQKDFTQERWQRAAGKNAFQLLSQHRYDAAAAFFLLARQPMRAVKACLHNLKDPMLALVVARLAGKSVGGAPGGPDGASAASPPSAVAYGAFDVQIELPELVDTRPDDEALFDSALFASTSIGMRRAGGGTAGRVPASATTSGSSSTPVVGTEESKQDADADADADADDEVVFEGDGTAAAAAAQLGADNQPAVNETPLQFVLRDYFAALAEDQGDPWVASLTLWLSGRPVASVAALLSSTPATLITAAFPGKRRRIGGSSSTSVSTSASPATSPAASSPTSEDLQHDAELIRFTRFLLDKPQLRADKVLQAIVEKMQATVMTDSKSAVAATQDANLRTALSTLAEVGGNAYARAGLPLLALDELANGVLHHDVASKSSTTTPAPPPPPAAPVSALDMFSSLGPRRGARPTPPPTPAAAVPAVSTAATLPFTALGAAFHVFQLVSQLLSAAAYAADKRVEAAAQLWHERAWGGLTKPGPGGGGGGGGGETMPVRRPRRSSTSQLMEHIDSTIAPVCRDVRSSLIDEMVLLRSLAERTTAGPTDAAVESAATPAAAAGASRVAARRPSITSTASLVADSDFGDILFRIADVQNLVHTRLDLACQDEDRADANMLLMLWSDAVGVGAGYIADGRSGGRHIQRLDSCACSWSAFANTAATDTDAATRLLTVADHVSRVTVSACWFARSQSPSAWPEDLTDVSHLFMWTLFVMIALEVQDYVALRQLLMPVNTRPALHTTDSSGSRVVPPALSFSVRGCLRHKAVHRLGNRLRPHHARRRRRTRPTPRAADSRHRSSADASSPLSTTEAWFEQYIVNVVRFLAAANVHALLRAASLNGVTVSSGGGGGGGERSDPLSVARSLLQQLVVATDEWQRDELVALTSCEPRPEVYEALKAVSSGSGGSASSSAAAAAGESHQPVPPPRRSKWDHTPANNTATRKRAAVVAAMRVMDPARLAIVQRLTGFVDDGPLVPGAPAGASWPEPPTPSASPATSTGGPRTPRSPSWWLDSVALFRNRRSRRQTNAAVMCWHMVGGPGVLWTVGCEGFGLRRAVRRKAIGYLPALPTERSVDLYHRRSGFVSAIATSSVRPRPTMVIATEAGVLEIDAVGVQIARAMHAGAGGGGSGGSGGGGGGGLGGDPASPSPARSRPDDPSTWRPSLTSSTTAQLSQEFSLVDVMSVASSGVVTWNHRAVSSRIKTFEADIDATMQAHWYAAQEHPSLHSLGHDGLLATSLDCHPVLPYYVSGGLVGDVCIWKEAEEHVVAQYNQHMSGVPFGVSKPGLSSSSSSSSASASSSSTSIERVTSLRFNTSGLSLAASDSGGSVYLWQTTRPEEPLEIIRAHTRRATDVSFLNNTTVVAVSGSSSTSAGIKDPTAGGGGGGGGGLASPTASPTTHATKDRPTLRIYDICCPPSAWEVASAVTHANGSTPLCMFYDEHSRAIVSGGDKGDIAVFDLRMHRLRASVPGAHRKAIKALAVDPFGRFFATGGADGDVKIWTLPDVRQSVTLPDLHPERMMMNHKLSDTMLGRSGVTDLVLTQDFLYSAGSNGCVTATPKVF